jgi:hypothetical protein
MLKDSFQQFCIKKIIEMNEKAWQPDTKAKRLSVLLIGQTTTDGPVCTETEIKCK